MENKTFEMMSVRVSAKAGTRSQNNKMAKNKQQSIAWQAKRSLMF